jgi:outer membrane autotransporter protein
MGNHMADVASGLVDLADGERHFHFQGLYGQTERDPSGGSPAGFDATQSGVSLGFDQKVDERTTWGLYAGYTKNDLDITHVAPAAGDWENQESWHFGGYVLYRTGNWILTDALTYRATDHETFRNQLDGAATAKFDSWSVTNDFRAGYMLREIDESSNWEIVPEIGFNFGYLSRDGYKEENGFTYGDFDTTVWESVLGVRFRGEFVREDGSKWVPSLRLSWVHLLSGDDVTVAQGWGDDWHTYTEVLDDDAFVVDLGVSLYTAGDTEISLNYNGRFSDNSEFHGAWLRFMKKF